MLPHPSEKPPRRKRTTNAGEDGVGKRVAVEITVKDPAETKHRATTDPVTLRLGKPSHHSDHHMLCSLLTTYSHQNRKPAVVPNRCIAEDVVVGTHKGPWLSHKEHKHTICRKMNIIY